MRGLSHNPAPLPPMSIGGVSLVNPEFRRGTVGEAVAGDAVLYTAPAGCRAIVVDIHAFNVSGLGPVTATAQVNISGTYHSLNAGASIVVGTTAGFLAAPFVLEPGESVGLNLSADGVNAWVRVIEFSNSTPIYSPRLTSFVNGNNTLYTCPSSSTSVLLGATAFTPANATNTLAYMNGSAGNVSRTWYCVSSGGAVAASTQVAAAGTIAAGAFSATSFRGGSL